MVRYKKKKIKEPEWFVSSKSEDGEMRRFISSIKVSKMKKPGIKKKEGENGNNKRKGNGREKQNFRNTGWFTSIWY